jgi:hypothetical protein
MPKHFTLAEAESLLPTVGRLLAEAVSLKSEFAEAERAVRAHSERVMLMGGMVVDREEIRAARSRREGVGGRLRAALESIQETGCVLKDLDIGLLDFPTLYRGREVYLCWKLGEAGISFWHGVEEGFAGRKPIDRDFREHQRGDAAQ